MNDSVILTKEDIEEMKKIRWYHSIKLGEVVTPGMVKESVHNWKSQIIPEDLSGMSVLDIGAWDGYYSFLAESRGAKRVLAIDVSQGWCNDRGFQFAKRALGSNVEHKYCSVYNLDILKETFDLILFYGVYYHLVNPILALQQIYNALNDNGVLFIEGLISLDHKPVLHALEESERPESTVYCAASIPWFQVIGEQIGFQDFKLISKMQRKPSFIRRMKTLTISVASKMGVPSKKHKRAIMKMRRPHNGLHPREKRIVYRRPRAPLTSLPI